MAHPHPAQGNQKQYTERPLKVFGEQYHAGGALPVGAVMIDLYTDGLPRVFTTTQAYTLHDTEWVITNRYSGRPIQVISDEEFTERFGGGGGPNADPEN
jgi:hypothetical protein